MANRSTKVFTNFIWRFAERSCAQIIQFVVTILLARIITPKEYGVVALLMVVISIMTSFVNCGLGTALVQKKDADELDFSTVFYANVCFGGLLYVVLFFCAPAIALYYENTSLTPYLRVLGISLIISSLYNVQQSYVSRNLIFKKFFYATLVGTIASGIIGIVMALSGYGVWALVAQNLSNNFFNTLMLWITVKWRPRAIFSFKRFVSLFNYGYKLLLSSVIDKIYNSLRTLIIGKLYTLSELAYYNKGHTFPSVIADNISTSVDGVIFPVMSKAQDNKEEMKSMTRRAIQVNTFVIAPCMMGLAFAATPIIRLLLTEKWMEAVPFMQIACVTYMFYPIHMANLNAIRAMGRSDIFLKLEIIKKAVGLAVIFATMRYGVLIMAYSGILTSVLSQIINSWPNKRLLNYGYLEQIKDILPNIILAVLMGVVVYCVEYLKLSDLLTVIIQIVVGAGTYIGLAFLTKNRSMEYTKNIFQNLLHKKS